MTKTLHPSYCVLCKIPFVKNGRNSAGNQRWRCPSCGSSYTRKREDRTRFFTLQRFVTWLLSKPTQQELSTGTTGRTFRHQTRWCWQIQPRIPNTGVIYDVLQIDGFNLRTGWCVLVATHQGKVIAYQWCARESGAAWGALFKRMPEPTVVVCDGGPGMHAALKEHWPAARVQRCLVHLQRNVRTHVTKRSKTEAGRSLWGLALKLTKVHNSGDAQAWVALFLQWETQYLHLTKERTYRKDTFETPTWVKPGQKWCYTQQRLRSGYQVFQRVIKAGHLFTFLDPTLKPLNVTATTNSIEGGTNAHMRLLLLHHRGITEQHQRRAIEWWLYTHSERPTRPHPNPRDPQPAEESSSL